MEWKSRLTYRPVQQPRKLPQVLGKLNRIYYLLSTKRRIDAYQSIHSSWNALNDTIFIFTRKHKDANLLKPTNMTRYSKPFLIFFLLLIISPQCHDYIILPYNSLISRLLIILLLQSFQYDIEIIYVLTTSLLLYVLFVYPMAQYFNILTMIAYYFNTLTHNRYFNLLHFYSYSLKNTSINSSLL